MGGLAVGILNLDVALSSTRIVEDVSVSTRFGEVTTFFGPSGCGKSTVLKCILGLVQPSSGVATIEGESPKDYHKPIAYTPQNSELLRWLDVESNVLLWHRESAASTSVRTGLSPQQAIEAVELSGACNKLPFELSGGMERRAALARCLATHSRVMLLDEAFTSVERRLRRKLMSYIRNHILVNEISALLVTHDIEEAVFMSDKVLMLTALPAQVSRTYDIPLPSVRDEKIFDTPAFDNAVLHLFSAVTISD